MASKKKYFRILGIPTDATQREIRQAYLKLAMKFHPDRNHEPGSVEKFKEIREAYAVLSGKEAPPRTHETVHWTQKTGHGGPTYSWQGDVARAWAGMAQQKHNNMYR